MIVLPSGWSEATLSDLVGSGGLFSDGDWVETKDQDPSGNIRLLQLADVGDGVFLDKSQRFVNDDKFELLRCTEIFPDDVLIARMPDPLGRACVAPVLGQRCITVVDVAIFRPGKDSVLNRWLMHFINAPSIRAEIDLKSSGTTRRRISRKNLGALAFPVPPRAEQKRITDKLDALLTRLAACRERLDRVPDILKRFRQSIIAAATNGEITREWREERSRQFDWQQLTLADVIQEKPRNGFSPRAVEYPTAVKSLTLSATTSGRFLGHDFKYIDQPISPDSHLWLRPGDILIQRANTLENVGVSAVFDGPEATFIYPDLMMRCRANERILTSFLHLVLSSEVARRYFRESATGTAGNMPKINQRVVMAAPVVVPPHEEQVEIVRRVTDLLAHADRLGAHLASAQAFTERATPSILAKAFRGELVPQDPNDEPASELLARIRAVRTAEEKSKPRRGGNRKTRTNKVTEISMLSRNDVKTDHLSAILKERGALSAEALWNASKLDIDEFYEQLKEEERQGLLRERRGKGRDDVRLLEPTK